MTDPRFDPAFQRGYSGPAPELVVREAAPPRPRTVPDVATPVVAETPDFATAVPENVTSPGETGPDALSDEPWQPPRRNPFAIAMLVGGLLLMVIAVAMIWSVATRNTSNAQSALDMGAQVITYLSYFLPPALFIGGILGVLGWLILGALDVARAQDRTP